MKLERQPLRRFFISILLIMGVLVSPGVLAAGWVAVGENGTVIYSADGLSWSSGTSNTSQTLLGVFSDGDGTWVASGQDGTIINSQDGAEWSPQDSGNNDALWGTSFQGGQWIVSGGAGQVVTSPDSSTWTSVNGPFGFTLYDIAYDGSSLYVIAGDSGFASTILVSTDGGTWAQRTPQVQPNDEGLYGIGFGNGLWVAVGDGGTILTSSDPDSRVWTAASSGTTANLRDIIFDAAGNWVVVGEGGVILRSTDGVNWTAQVSGTSSDLWGVEFDPAGRYIAVGFDGTILASPDAITWTPQASPTTERLRDVAIGKLPQVIDFPAQDPLFQTFTVNGTYPLNPVATATSGLPVSYATLTPASCAITGTTITMLSEGECRIEASQSGDDTYLPAVPVSQSVLQLVAVGPGLPTNPGLVFDPQDSEPFVAGATFALAPPASTTQTPVDPQPAIVYVSNTPSVCTIPFLGSIEVSMVSAGTCSLTAASAPNSLYLAGTPITRPIALLPPGTSLPTPAIPVMTLPFMALLILLTGLLAARHRSQ